MRRTAAATILLAGMALSGVHAAGVSPETALQVPPELVSPYRQYDLRLRTFSPTPRQPVGALLSVKINRGRSLRLVLDSGADLIVIGSKAARAAGLSAGSELDLVGLGSRPAKVGQAATVEIGPVAFRNCRVAFVKGNVIEGADGVIPLSLFSGFIVRLNLPEETLDLIPYATNVDPDIQPARGVIRHHRLLVATVLEGKRNGYLVLDTGASCSVISRESARTLGGFPMLPEVRLAAGTGAATGQRISASVHFAIADQDVVLDQVVALDLSNLSRLFGVEILGVLGFPDLSNYVLTIDYAGGQVRMQRHARSWARILQSDENSDLPAVVK